MVFEHFFDFYRFLCKTTCFLSFCRNLKEFFVQNSFKTLTIFSISNYKREFLIWQKFGNNMCPRERKKK